MNRATDVTKTQRLDEITTRWETLSEPTAFVMRYAPAIRRYVAAIIRNEEAAEEVLQDFLIKVMRTGFNAADPGRGRFRDYLKTAVRNAALIRLRRARAEAKHSSGEKARTLRYQPPAGDEADLEWRDQWRRSILERAWSALDEHQRAASGNLAFTVLWLVIQFPSEDSKALAKRASALSGVSVENEVFRKQLSRARRLFAKLLLREVAQTLGTPTPQMVEEELAELGLMKYVRDFLPSDWSSSGMLPAVIEAKRRRTNRSGKKAVGKRQVAPPQNPIRSP